MTTNNVGMGGGVHFDRNRTRPCIRARPVLVKQAHQVSPAGVDGGVAVVVWWKRGFCHVEEGVGWLVGCCCCCGCCFLGDSAECSVLVPTSAGRYQTRSVDECVRIVRKRIG